MSSECARHPGVTAVEICARCGAFACGDCVEYQRDDVPLCAPCFALVREVPTPMRARLPVVPAGLSSALLLAGFLTKGRPGLWLWLGASVLAMGGLAWASLEWRRQRGQKRALRWLRAALALSGVSVLGLTALAAAFFAFLRR